MTISFPDGVQRWPIDRVRKYDRNARTHDKKQVDQIVASIQEFGFTNPLLITTDGEIIAGHCRLMAAEQLELTEVPVIVLGHLSDVQRRAYVIADNQLALNAGWDDDLLKSELTDLENLEFDLTLLGWGEDLPEFTKEPDYSILEEENDEALDQLESGVKKAILIEFEPEHYEEAMDLLRFWRARDSYIGLMLIEMLAREKAKLS